MRGLKLAVAALALAGCAATPPAAQNGVILAAVPTDQPGQNSGAGAIAGAVLLGGAGGAAGSAAGKALAITAGMIVGAAAGSAAEAASQGHSGVAYTIQLAGGQVVTLVEHLDSGERILAPGSQVTVQTLGPDQTVVAR